MSLIEMLPDLQALSRVEKLRLIQLLARELAEVEDSSPIPPSGPFPVWSPDQAFTAAETLLQALRMEKDPP